MVDLVKVLTWGLATVEIIDGRDSYGKLEVPEVEGKVTILELFFNN